MIPKRFTDLWTIEGRRGAAVLTRCKTCLIVSPVDSRDIERDLFVKCYECAYASTVRQKLLTTKFTLDRVEHRQVWVRCVCGRLRAFSRYYFNRTDRQTCGCDPQDALYIKGDPHLPPDVTGVQGLCWWIGFSYDRLQYLKAIEPWHKVKQLLVEAADKKFPGRGALVNLALPD